MILLRTKLSKICSVQPNLHPVQMFLLHTGEATGLVYVTRVEINKTRAQAAFGSISFSAVIKCHCLLFYEFPLSHSQQAYCAHTHAAATVCSRSWGVHTDVILPRDDSRFHAAALSSSKVLNGAWKKKKNLPIRACVCVECSWGIKGAYVRTWKHPNTTVRLTVIDGCNHRERTRPRWIQWVGCVSCW